MMAFPVILFTPGHSVLIGEDDTGFCCCSGNRASFIQENRISDLRAFWMVLIVFWDWTSILGRRLFRTGAARTRVPEFLGTMCVLSNIWAISWVYLFLLTRFPLLGKVLIELSGKQWLFCFCCLEAHGRASCVPRFFFFRVTIQQGILSPAAAPDT